MRKEEDPNVFKALCAARYRITQPPGLIRVVKLNIYLLRCPNQNQLAKEIVYCYIVKPENRSGLYSPAQRATPVNWERLALLKKTEKPTVLKDLFAVDFSLLDKEKEKYLLFENFPNFKRELEMELNYAQTNGSSTGNS